MRRNSTAEIIDMPAVNDRPGKDEGDHLSPFASEVEPAPAPKRSRPSRKLPIAVMSVCASVVAGWFIWQTWTATSAASAPLAEATGIAEFHSVPDESSVAIDGTVRGSTPLKIELPVGKHSITITNGSLSRTIAITLTPGSTVSQYVELGTVQAAQGGRLEVGSDPAGAQVSIDGAVKGRTPLMLEDVAPGQYRVTVTTNAGTAMNRTVNVTRGTTSTVVFSASPTSAADGAAGWVSIQAPFDMDILEGGRVLGNTRMDRLMLPVGAHRLEFANAGLEFTAARTVQVVPGKTVNVTVALPPGRISVNAIPWAEVWLDGTSLGTTPLGDVTVPIGTHDLVFRHPQLGERRQTVTVKAQTTARIGIDLRK